MIFICIFLMCTKSYLLYKKEFGIFRSLFMFQNNSNRIALYCLWTFSRFLINHQAEDLSGGRRIQAHWCSPFLLWEVGLFRLHVTTVISLVNNIFFLGNDLFHLGVQILLHSLVWNSLIWFNFFFLITVIFLLLFLILYICVFLQVR